MNDIIKRNRELTQQAIATAEKIKQTVTEALARAAEQKENEIRIHTSTNARRDANTKAGRE